MKVIALIPARYDSERFPGKLMEILGNKTIILSTYEAAIKTGLFESVYVVTDSKTIKDEIEKNNGNVIMSQKEHECGSDRIAEAAQNIDADIIINVQGDEPFIDKNSLEKLIEAFTTKETVDLASLKEEIKDIELVNNPNCVKVITDLNNFAIYFSRSPIPFNRSKEIATKYYKHIGIYAFRKQALLDFSNTPATPLELAEKIECIRYLETDKRIKMIETSFVGIGIDTPEDLEKARELL
jgi:3-deoxy-manno-octulosonate cytidylyltransferase (CMP-KDO synthetase)